MSTERSKPETLYLVVNQSKTIGFLTNVHQLAIEFRNPSNVNCLFLDDITGKPVDEHFKQHNTNEPCEIIGPIHSDKINVVTPSDEDFGIVIPPDVFIDVKYELD